MSSITRYICDNCNSVQPEHDKAGNRCRVACKAHGWVMVIPCCTGVSECIHLCPDCHSVFLEKSAKETGVTQ